MAKTLKEKLLEERKEVVDLLAVRIKSFIDAEEEFFIERAWCGCTDYRMMINRVVNPPKTPRKLRKYPSDEILDEVAERLTAKLGFKVKLYDIGGDVWMMLDWSLKGMS